MQENTTFLNDLLKNKLVTQPVLDYLLSKNSNNPFDVLIELSQNPSINRNILGTLWGDSIDVAYTDLEKMIIEPEILNKIPKEIAEEHNVVALYKFGDVITIAVSNPKNAILLDKIEKITKSKVSPLFAFPDSIKQVIEKNYPKEIKKDEVKEKIEEQSLNNLTEKLSHLKLNKKDSGNKNNYSEEDETKSVISEKVKKVWVDNTRSIMNDVYEGKIPSMQACNTLQNSIIEEVHNKFDLVKCVNQLRIFDEYTYSHSINVAVLSSAIAKHFGFQEKQLKEITLGAMLHDLGKMRIPKVILYKPTALTEEEMTIAKRHPELGYKMITQMNVPEIVADVALNHHERANGSGYPRRLNINQTSVYDQIVSIIDVYDALISDRPYKKAVPFHQAINILFLEGKSAFNDSLLYKFVEIVYQKNTEMLTDEFKTMFLNKK